MKWVCSKWVEIVGQLFFRLKFVLAIIAQSTRLFKLDESSAFGRLFTTGHFLGMQRFADYTEFHGENTEIHREKNIKTPQ
jgi:hypothetical protein